ncbi:hypothetical protein SEA_SHWETA_43 [Mycobacterium phage Shweta]|nr:hypothetical protein SEA_SHWETA_43 [Mycobacterium phage Shweta]WRQ08188.1 hypothetical protein JDBV06_00815 [Mycobacterium phage dwieneke]
MSAAKCRRCGRYWSFMGNPDLFAVITKFCPECIARVLPLMGSAS